MADDNLVASKNIWFVFGLSGAGKSYLSEFISKQNNWFHLEIDQSPGTDGIDLFGLRPEWDLFFHQGIPSGLTGKLEMLYMSKGFAGIVVSFPSRYMIAKEQIDKIKSGVVIIYLYGKKSLCLNSFLKRERETGRNLSPLYWNMNNDIPYMLMADSSLSPYRINVFTKTGEYKTREEILKEIQIRKN